MADKKLTTGRVLSAILNGQHHAFGLSVRPSVRPAVVRQHKHLPRDARVISVLSRGISMKLGRCGVIIM